MSKPSKTLTKLDDQYSSLGVQEEYADYSYNE